MLLKFNPDCFGLEAKRQDMNCGLDYELHKNRVCPSYPSLSSQCLAEHLAESRMNEENSE